MRALLLLPFLLFSACSTTPYFAGTSDDIAWDQHALAHPNDAPSYKQFSDAYHGDPTAVRAYFAEALRQCETFGIDAAGGESLDWTLQTLLHRLGDQKFAAILTMEPPRSQSAVGNFLSDPAITKFPRTHYLLMAAPKIDFPLNRAERG